MIEAWHFLSEDRHTRFDPRVLVTPGMELVHKGTLELCERGFHASARAIDALKYAPGPIICGVILDGDMLNGDDKYVAMKRKVLWMADATEALHEMACISATTALLSANVKDPRCWAAIEAKRAWRRGEIDDAALDAARSAAESAAWSAARSAARSVAESAAWSEQNTVLEALLNDLPRDAGPQTESAKRREERTLSQKELG